MKICFLAGTLDRGGAERQLVYMLRALKAEGVDTTLLCLTSGEPLEDEIRQLGIDVQWLGSSSTRLARAIEVISAVRRSGADIVQSSHYYTNIYAGIAGRALGLPSIGAIRNNLTSEIAADRVFGKWQTKLPRHLIANSDAAYGTALELGIDPSRIDVIRNVVEVDENDPNEPAVVAEGVRILFVGRLVEQKRPELFVKLASEMRRRHPDVTATFEMVGEGPMRNDLEDLKASVGSLNGEFVFAGPVSDMSSVYRRSDILVLTSDFEGTPNVVLEAMAHGIPVVATAVGGVPEILTADRGVMVDAGDLDGLCEGTRKLAADAGLRRSLGRRGKQYAAQHHSLTHLGDRLLDVYEKLLGGRRKS